VFVFLLCLKVFCADPVDSHIEKKIENLRVAMGYFLEDESHG